MTTPEELKTDQNDQASETPSVPEDAFKVDAQGSVKVAVTSKTVEPLNGTSTTGQGSPIHSEVEDEDATEADEPCALESVLETLADESEDPEDAGELRKTFLLWGLYYVDERVFEKYHKKLIKAGHSKKYLRAAYNLCNPDRYPMYTLAESLLASKHFNIPLEQAIAECVSVDTSLDLTQEELLKVVAYIQKHVNLSELEADDCVYKPEDIYPELLAKLVPGGAVIETASRFGKNVEKLCQSSKNVFYYKPIRDAMVQFAIGIIDKGTWNAQMKPYARVTNKAQFDKTVASITEAITDAFGMQVKFGYTDDQILDYYDDQRVIDDLNYAKTVLGDQVVTLDQLCYKDDIEPIEQDEPEEATQEADQGMNALDVIELLRGQKADLAGNPEEEQLRDEMIEAIVNILPRNLRKKYDAAQEALEEQEVPAGDEVSSPQ